MIRHKFVGATLAAGLALTTLAACGSTRTSTAESVPAALTSTVNQSAMQLTVTLKGSPSALPSRHLTAAQKQAILASSLVMTVHAANGTTLANPGQGGELALSLVEGGSRLAQLEEVGSTLYARVDISQIASTYHLDPSTVARVRGMLARYSSQVTALKALSQGRWVSLDLAGVQPFAQAAGINLPSAPQVAAALTTSLFRVLAQASGTSTATSGQHQVTVNLRQLATAVAQTISSNPGLSKLSSQFGNLTQKAQHEVPANRSAVVDVTVSNGIVSNLQVPLNQFDTDHHLNGPLSINVAVGSAGPVSAPSGAVAVDLGQLLGVLGRSFSR